jgi:hypothetical protein
MEPNYKKTAPGNPEAVFFVLTDTIQGMWFERGAKKKETPLCGVSLEASFSPSTLPEYGRADTGLPRDGRPYLA